MANFPGDALGQQVVVDGVGGIIVMEIGAAAAPEGFNFESSGWNRLIAQRAVPRSVLEQLHGTVGKIAATPACREQMTRQGAVVIVNTAQAFEQFIRKEFELFGPAVKAANLKTG